MIWPNSGKPEFGGESQKNDGRVIPRRLLQFPALPNPIAFMDTATAQK
jgi:hypothetical protein